MGVGYPTSALAYQVARIQEIDYCQREKPEQKRSDCDTLSNDPATLKARVGASANQQKDKLGEEQDQTEIVGQVSGADVGSKNSSLLNQGNM